jgi:PAS domain S-box-containing protein
MRTLSGWAIAVWAVAFTMLILDVGVSTYNIDALVANDRDVSRSRDISRALADAASALTDAETSQRGYHLTDDEAYLMPYWVAIKDMPGLMGHLREVTGGDPFYDARVDRMAQLVDEKFAELQRSLDVRKAAGAGAALAAIREGHGKRTMDRFRELTTEMENHERDILGQKSREAKEKHKSSTVATLFGGVITVLMVAMAFAVVRKELLRRQEAEVRASEKAADLAESQRTTTESLALLDAFLENAPIGIAFFDTELRYIRINQYLAAANGRAVIEHVGRPILEAVPDMPTTIVGDLREVAKTGQPLLNREATGRPGNVDRIWLSSYFPVRTRDGHQLGIGVVAQDVTERLTAIRQMRESEARKTAILETALDCVISIDHTGRVLDFNPAAEHTFGYSRPDVVGHDMAELIVPTAHRDRHREGLSRYLESGAGRVLNRRLEMPARRKDGDEFPAELAITAIHVGGQPIFTAYLRDITDRKRAEDSLRQSRDRFRTLVEAIPQMVFETDAKGTVTSTNGRWVEFTGRAAIETPDWTSVVHPDEASAASATWHAAVNDSVDRYTRECRFRAYDGAYRWMLINVVPLVSAGGSTQWVATLTDIEDQKRQRETLAALVKMKTSELESANRLLREQVAERARAESRVQAAVVELGRSNEELEKFAYVASHDLQEPLRKIQAFGDRLSKKYREVLGTDGQEYVDRMKASATRMRTLIDDLLTFSRVSTKARPIAAVDLDAILREVLSDLETRLSQTGGNVDTDDLPTIAADPVQMRQLFLNLLGNALKFHKIGTAPEVVVRAIPWSAISDEADPPPPGGDGYRITVSDNGIGFDPAYSERIFEVFQRLHGRSVYEGTGIGLAIVRKIVVRHGGQIVARSRDGLGANFIIDLPASAG